MKPEGVNVDWAEEFNGAITVCNCEGIIVYMNKFSVKQFAKYGGEKLLGSNLLDCHSETSKSKIREMLKAPAENMYITEKNGVRKIIFQTPWMQDGQFSGLVELFFLFSQDVPLFVRG